MLGGKAHVDLVVILTEAIIQLLAIFACTTSAMTV